MTVPTDIITTTDYQTLRRELRHSIELTRNAKGEYSWSIKVYFALALRSDEERTPDAIQRTDLALRDLYVTDKGQP